MDKLDEILDLLKTATPMLQEFIQWKQQEAEKEKAYLQEKTESQKEFEAWLRQHKAEEAQQEKDAAELKKHLYGGEKWREEHLIPKPF